MKKLFWVLAASAGMLVAQEKGAEAPRANPTDTVRVIEVKQADPYALQRTLSGVLGGLASVNATPGALVVRGSGEAVSVIEAAIKKLDVPPAPTPENRPAPNVELTVHLLYASAQEDPTATVPQDLDGTVRQLRSLFPYKGYRVLDTLVIRSRSGRETVTNGTLPGSDSSYDFRFRPEVAAGPVPRIVRLGSLQLSVKMRSYPDPADKTRYQFLDSGIRTELDAREGQKTVVGKSNVSGTDDAIILVVSPKVIE